jgi:hypothetical protein
MGAATYAVPIPALVRKRPVACTCSSASLIPATSMVSLTSLSPNPAEKRRMPSSTTGSCRARWGRLSRLQILSSTVSTLTETQAALFKARATSGRQASEALLITAIGMPRGCSRSISWLRPASRVGSPSGTKVR